MNRRIVQLSASVGCCVSCFYGFSLVRHDFVVNLWPYSTVFCTVFKNLCCVLGCVLVSNRVSDGVC